MRNEDLARQREEGSRQREQPRRGGSEGRKTELRDLRRAQVGATQVGASRQGRVRGIASPTGGTPPSQGPASVRGEPLMCVTQGGPPTCPSKPSVGPAAASHLPHLSRSQKAPSRLPRLTVAHRAPVTASRSQVLGENICGLNGGKVGSGFTDKREMWGVKGASRGLRGARLQWGRPRAVTSRPPSSSPFHLSLLTWVHKRGCNSLSALIDQRWLITLGVAINDPI